ncbi:hypothetical protein F4553_003704 [Allocatelliglobosispora scoriae]|uniref:Uncharacterized protein n=1 Tax=Allocatelliglobosispora scoriae TaxID=643052 RepID=A0A841BRJ5_9ACTN|nr:permease [Allocatelliglobosispora scoriae]MBB5870325.1 hypothetical protein [Allocatelliglobosispora scoriae]
MEQTQCSMCGRLRDPAQRCPSCGNTAEDLAAELDRLNRAIADMSAEDLTLASARSGLSKKMQAALHQRRLIQHAEQERLKAANTPKQRRLRRNDPPPTGSIPAQGTGPDRPRVAPLLNQPAPETSARSAQNLLLALGGLLLGVAAIVFAVVAISSFSPAARVTILTLVTLLLLGGAPFLIKARLTSTAETLATVGLVLVPVTGYVVGMLPGVTASMTIVSGFVFAVTSAVAYGYHRLTLLTSARYAVVIAVQPVVPLLAFDLIRGPAGWALVFALMAGANAVIARAVEHSHSMPLRVGGSRNIGDFVHRPVVLEGAWSSYWLRELTWVLHGLTVIIALAFGTFAMMSADEPWAAARAGATVLLAAGIGFAGASVLALKPLPEVTAGILTIAVIAVVGRVTALALPGRELLAVAVAAVVTGLGVRLLPRAARRGPQIAASVALAIIGFFVLSGVLRAAMAPIRAAFPAWRADLSTFGVRMSDAAGPDGWSLVTTIALVTIAAALALPPSFRREAVVAGATLTGLAAPASLGLSWIATQWLLTAWAIAIAAAGIGVVGSAVPSQRLRLPSFSRIRNQDGSTIGLSDRLFGPVVETPVAPGLGAGTRRAARAHVAGVTIVGLAAILASVARPWSTASVLVAISVAGVLLAVAQRLLRTAAPTAVIGDACAGAVALAFPSAVAASVVTLAPDAPTSTVLACACLAASGTLGYVAMRLVAQRHIGTPLAVGAGLGALAITLATFGVPNATVLDTLVATVLLVGAVLLGLSSSIDAGRQRADRLLDGADYAAAAVTAGGVAALARAASLIAPGIWVLSTAIMVLIVSASVQLMPEEWRRGPIAGVTIAGAVVLVIAGYPALTGGLQAIAVPGGLWEGDLGSVAAASSLGWQGPAALVVLACAAALGLPKPLGYDAAGLAVGLATVGTPAALGGPWWSPIVIGLAISTGYAIASVIAPEPRAGYARLTVAVALALYALGSSLVRDWTTAAALGVVALVCVVVAALVAGYARIRLGDTSIDEEGPEGPHLSLIGGTATVGALLAAPGAVAALAATMDRDPRTILAACLATTAVGVAILGAVRKAVPAYLGWATVGVSAGGTIVALAELTLPHPTGVYAAAAALMCVLIELIRTGTPMVKPIRPTTLEQPAFRPDEAVRWRIAGWSPELPQWRRWPSYPAAGAFVAAALPALIAVIAIAPTIREAIATPYRSLDAIWEGPPAGIGSAVNATAVLTALLLTIAAGIAAIGFGGGVTRSVTRVTAMAGLTLLILPTALNLSWSARVLAGLTVFTVCVLSVALTEPPTDSDTDRPLRTGRLGVLLMGLIAGGAGLAGALATPGMTIFTFGGAVAVGAAAALGGRSQTARILGWLGASVAAELFVVAISIDAGLAPQWTAFGVLAIGALLMTGATTLPRLARVEAEYEAATVEWAGHIAAIIALVVVVRAPHYMAPLLAAWGSVIGIALMRAGLRPNRRIVLLGAIGLTQIIAWWLIGMSAENVSPEAYTVPFAAVALIVGAIELRRRQELLDSWTAFGPGLVTAFGPTVVIVLVTEAAPIREVGLIVAAVLTLIYGSVRRQQAPLAIGSVVTAIAALHALSLVSPWLILVPLGITLVILGASSERRRQLSEGYRTLQ